MKWRWNRTMLNLCSIVVAILKMATGRNFSMSGNHFPFSKWPPQYRTNSTLFDFNVLNWFPTSKNFYQSPFSKWPPQYCKNSTLSNVKVIQRQYWYATHHLVVMHLHAKYHKPMWRNKKSLVPTRFSMSWIDSRHRKISTSLHFQNGHHNTAKIQHCLISKVAFNLFFKPVDVRNQFGTS
jgi:hypothetical protein